MRHQNISEPLHGIAGSNFFDKMILEVLAKIWGAKSNKELEFFHATGFDCDQELGEPPDTSSSEAINNTATSGFKLAATVVAAVYPRAAFDSLLGKSKCL